MVIYIEPCGCNEPIKENGLFFLTILTTNSVIYELNKKMPTLIFQIKYTDPCEGKIFFHSEKARDFFAEYLEEKYFMTFTNYPGRNTNCRICGARSTIKYNGVFLCDEHYLQKREK